MAKYANGLTYREGNDNLNEQQFTQMPAAEPFKHGPHSIMKRPATETRTITQQRRGEKGGSWKKKGR